MSHRELHVKQGEMKNYDFIDVKCEGLADTREHEPPLGGGLCLTRAAMRHNPLAVTEARLGGCVAQQQPSTTMKKVYTTKTTPINNY